MMKPARKHHIDRHALLRGLSGTQTPLTLSPAAKAIAKAERAKDWRVWGRKLTKIFNRYIRLRDTHSDNAGDRFGNCISCSRLFWFDQLDAGHFIGSQHLGTKWHEKNVHAQCRKCNRFEEGQKADYSKAIQNKFGSKILDELALAKKMGAKHPDVLMLKAKVEIYTEKCKELEADR